MAASSDFDVVIVGAGLSGLYTAHCLRRVNASLRILILEGAPVIGGRVRTLTQFARVPIELGAELVHGSDTLLNRAIADAGLRTETVFTWAQGDGGPHPEHPVNGGCGYYYIGAERRLLRFDALDFELVHLNTTLNEMQTVADANNSSSGSSTTSSSAVASSSSPPSSSSSPPAVAQTVRDYLVASGCTPRTIAQAEAGYANTVCASLAWLPRDQSAIVMAGFEGDGENEWRCLDGYDKLLAHLRGQSEIWCNWPVARIEYGGSGMVQSTPSPASQSPLQMARIVSQSGECVRARRVVVTASVAALRHVDDGIAFDPPLPEARLAVLRRLRMEPCLKVALKFRARFWPRDMHGMVCSDCVFPEMWAVAPHCLASTQQNDAPSSDIQEEAILIFFAAAEFATRIGAMTRTQLRAAALAQLDQIFGNGNGNSATVATDAFVDLVVQDWTKERFVRGGYSAPSPGVTSADRAACFAPLTAASSSPLSSTLSSSSSSSSLPLLVFAGEATRPDRYMVMHAALESGVEAAKCILLADAQQHVRDTQTRAQLSAQSEPKAKSKL